MEHHLPLASWIYFICNIFRIATLSQQCFSVLLGNGSHSPDSRIPLSGAAQAYANFYQKKTCEQGVHLINIKWNTNPGNKKKKIFSVGCMWSVSVSIKKKITGRNLSCSGNKSIHFEGMCFKGRRKLHLTGYLPVAAWAWKRSLCIFTADTAWETSSHRR